MPGLGKPSGQRNVTRGKRDPHVTGNAGLFYSCYRFSLLGWNVMPTARNARGVDIIAYDSQAIRYIGVQVKSLNDRSPVPMGTNLEKIMGDWWVIVNNLGGQPTAFIMLPSEVRDRAHRGEKDGRVSFWLQPKEYDLPEFHEAWDRIGRGDSERATADK